MKKKILALGLCVAMLAIAVIGGSLAYFTDTDQATNVMVTGNVSIIQNEQQRSKDNVNTLEAFEDGKPLYPATGDSNRDGKIDTGYQDSIHGDTFVDENGKTQTIEMINRPNEKNVFSLNNNVVDKIITVTNDGNNEAYVRTLIAFEIPTMEDAKDIYGDNVPNYVTPLDKDGKYVDVVNMAHFLYTVMHEGATEGKGYTLPLEDEDYIIIEDTSGVAYLVTEYYYKNDSKLASKETTHPSLLQIYLSAQATNEDAELVVGEDGQYNILAVSQAVQTAGFTSAEEAMKAAFGEVNAENCKEWIFTNVPELAE